MQQELDPAHVRAFFTYDPETGHIFSLAGRRIGYRDHEGYIRLRLPVTARDSRPQLRAHRLAFVAMLGRWPLLDVDHINGDRADNRWDNLREVDRATNSQNQRRATRGNSTSGVLGVSLDRRSGLWLAQIETRGKNRNLGRFATVEAAQAAYLAAKRRLHAGCTI